MEAREMEPNYVNSRIGEKIKDLRNKNGLTQQELADRAELTKGYISQLERGQVVYSEGAFFEKIDEVGNSIQWIVPNAQQNQMEPLLVVVQPKEQLQEDKPHEGEEFGYVISGRIRLHLGDKSYVVKSGESFYFRANRNHFIENTGSRPAKFVWVSTPPTF